jgi:hypothetical protein
VRAGAGDTVEVEGRWLGHEPACDCRGGLEGFDLWSVEPAFVEVHPSPRVGARHLNGRTDDHDGPASGAEATRRIHLEPQPRGSEKCRRSIGNEQGGSTHSALGGAGSSRQRRLRLALAWAAVTSYSKSTLISRLIQSLGGSVNELTSNWMAAKSNSVDLLQRGHARRLAHGPLRWGLCRADKPGLRRGLAGEDLQHLLLAGVRQHGARPFWQSVNRQPRPSRDRPHGCNQGEAS